MDTNRINTIEMTRKIRDEHAKLLASKSRMERISFYREQAKKMNTQAMSLEQIRIAGMEALPRELGIVGMVRFLQQFETGHGDYSKDRHKWLDDQDMDTVLKRIREKRATHKKKK